MDKAQPVAVACPTCRKPVPWTSEEKYKPFCSERCKMIDLGDWATETHKIAGEPVFDAEQQPPSPD